MTRDRVARTITLSQAQYRDHLLEKYAAWLDLARHYDAPLDSAKLPQARSLKTVP